MPKLVVVADSTQIDKFLECPMLWHYSMKQNYIPLQVSGSNGEFDSDNVKMDNKSMGSYGHKILEIYYIRRKSGDDTNKAINYAFDYSKWIDKLPERESKSIFGCIQKLGPKNISFINERIRFYTYTYQDDYIPDRLEVGFSHNLFEDNDHLFVLEGRIDFLGSINYQQKLFVDHKFQSTRKNLYEKAIQFRNYAMVTGELFGVINYIRMAKNVDANTFKRAPISFSQLEMESWRRELIEIYIKMADMIDRYSIQKQDEPAIERTSFERRRSACLGRFNYPCSYIPLCDEPTPTLVEIKKKTLYTVGEPWKPWHEGE